MATMDILMSGDTSDVYDKDPEREGNNLGIKFISPLAKIPLLDIYLFLPFANFSALSKYYAFCT